MQDISGDDRWDGRNDDNKTICRPRDAHSVRGSGSRGNATVEDLTATCSMPPSRPVTPGDRPVGDLLPLPIRSIADIEAIEAQPLASRALPESTYEAIAAAARRTPGAKALSFFAKADGYKRTFTWTYAELLADITRAANAFHALGVSADHPVAFVLPNLPETHFTSGAPKSSRCGVRDQSAAGLRRGARHFKPRVRALWCGANAGQIDHEL